MKFKLSSYILPSVISMVLVGSYTNIDGLFIGNVAGDAGLAAINFAWPIVALITAIGTGIGIGGSVILNNKRGEGDEAAAGRVKATMIMLLATVGILSGVLLLLVSTPLLKLMGAEGEALRYAVEYSNIICIGSVFQIMGAGLVALLRNENKTYFSMVCCIVGLVVHVALDWLLCGRYALAGVAVSTVTSQAVIMVLCLAALRSKTKNKVDKGYILPVLKAATSPMGLNFVPSAVLLFTNFFAAKIGGENGVAAVAAYAVMSYAVYTFDYVFQGVCDGIQPIISFCRGSGDKAEEKRAVKSAVIILGVCVAVFIALTPALIYFMPKVFNTTGIAEQMMKSGFIIYAVSYPFKAAVKFICSYYYAGGKTMISNLLIYVDPLILTPALLILLPKFFAVDGIWLSLTVAQLIVTALGLLSFKFKPEKDDIK